MAGVEEQAAADAAAAAAAAAAIPGYDVDAAVLPIFTRAFEPETGLLDPSFTGSDLGTGVPTDGPQWIASAEDVEVRYFDPCILLASALHNERVWNHLLNPASPEGWVCRTAFARLVDEIQHGIVSENQKLYVETKDDQPYNARGLASTKTKFREKYGLTREERSTVVRSIARLFVAYAGFMLTLPSSIVQEDPALPVDPDAAELLADAMQSPQFRKDVSDRMSGSKETPTGVVGPYDSSLGIEEFVSRYQEMHGPYTIDVGEFLTLAFVSGAQEAIGRGISAAGVKSAKPNLRSFAKSSGRTIWGFKKRATQVNFLLELEREASLALSEYLLQLYPVGLDAHIALEQALGVARSGETNEMHRMREAFYPYARLQDSIIAGCGRLSIARSTFLASVVPNMKTLLTKPSFLDALKTVSRGMQGASASEIIRVAHGRGIRANDSDAVRIMHETALLNAIFSDSADIGGTIANMLSVLRSGALAPPRETPQNAVGTQMACNTGVFLTGSAGGSTVRQYNAYQAALCAYPAARSGFRTGTPLDLEAYDEYRVDAGIRQLLRSSGVSPWSSGAGADDDGGSYVGISQPAAPVQNPLTYSIKGATGNNDKEIRRATNPTISLWSVMMDERLNDAFVDACVAHLSNAHAFGPARRASGLHQDKSVFSKYEGVRRMIKELDRHTRNPPPPNPAHALGGNMRLTDLVLKASLVEPQSAKAGGGSAKPIPEAESQLSSWMEELREEQARSVLSAETRAAQATVGASQTYQAMFATEIGIHGTSLIPSDAMVPGVDLMGWAAEAGDLPVEANPPVQAPSRRLKYCRDIAITVWNFLGRERGSIGGDFEDTSSRRGWVNRELYADVHLALVYALSDDTSLYTPYQQNANAAGNLLAPAAITEVVRAELRRRVVLLLAPRPLRATNQVNLYNHHFKLIRTMSRQITEAIMNPGVPSVMLAKSRKILEAMLGLTRRDSTIVRLASSAVAEQLGGGGGRGAAEQLSKIAEVLVSSREANGRGLAYYETFENEFMNSDSRYGDARNSILSNIKGNVASATEGPSLLLYLSALELHVKGMLERDYSEDFGDKTRQNGKESTIRVFLVMLAIGELLERDSSDTEVLAEDSAVIQAMQFAREERNRAGPSDNNTVMVRLWNRLKDRANGFIDRWFPDDPPEKELSLVLNNILREILASARTNRADARGYMRALIAHYVRKLDDTDSLHVPMTLYVAEILLKRVTQQKGISSKVSDPRNAPAFPNEPKKRTLEETIATNASLISSLEGTLGGQMESGLGNGAKASAAGSMAPSAKSIASLIVKDDADMQDKFRKIFQNVIVDNNYLKTLGGSGDDQEKYKSNQEALRILLEGVSDARKQRNESLDAYAKNQNDPELQDVAKKERALRAVKLNARGQIPELMRTFASAIVGTGKPVPTAYTDYMNANGNVLRDANAAYLEYKKQSSAGILSFLVPFGGSSQPDPTTELAASERPKRLDPTVGLWGDAEFSDDEEALRMIAKDKNATAQQIAESFKKMQNIPKTRGSRIPPNIVAWANSGDAAGKAPEGDPAPQPEEAPGDEGDDSDNGEGEGRSEDEDGGEGEGEDGGYDEDESEETAPPSPPETPPAELLDPLAAGDGDDIRAWLYHVVIPIVSNAEYEASKDSPLEIRRPLSLRGGDDAISDVALIVRDFMRSDEGVHFVLSSNLALFGATRAALASIRMTRPRGYEYEPTGGATSPFPWHKKIPRINLDNIVTYESARTPFVHLCVNFSRVAAHRSLTSSINEAGAGRAALGVDADLRRVNDLGIGERLPADVLGNASFNTYVGR